MNTSSIPSVSSLSLREKIGQTCQIHGDEIGRLDAEARRDYFARNPVGSTWTASLRPHCTQ